MTDFTCNTNYLSATSFKIVISREDYPHLQFFAQEVSHPSCDVPAAETSFKRIASVPFPGDAAQYGPLSMTIIMDEQMGVYNELYSWLLRLVNEKHKPQSFSLRSSNNEELSSYSDMRLLILSSHNNPIKQFKYVNVFPVSLGSINFQSTAGDTNYITFQADFRFDYFELI